VEVAEETASRVDAGASVARKPMREAARATEVTGGAAVATSAVGTTPVEPPRKRQRVFSTLR
jgi:hypothetical protein